MGQAKRRNALHPEKLGSLDPAMPGDDLVVIADQDRVGEAELLDAVGDLPDLLLGMGAGVSRVRPQACDRHGLDRKGLLHMGRPDYGSRKIDGRTSAWAGVDVRCRGYRLHTGSSLSADRRGRICRINSKNSLDISDMSEMSETPQRPRD